ncbi:excinuclease ABC subunit C [Bacillus sp. DJP31]|uniref:excinuclease ABC subunit C n=1 Tax=Bacillus sp. DJP31 TaxID=3409789 RepID=UPI003BB53F4D
MEKEQPNINQIKLLAKRLINKNSHREVTSETKHNNSGIYMIYIDNFHSENIVPIYIGQAKDIQKRYKQHLTEILALNRISYEEYHKYFFSKSTSFYEGKFKSCKIFKFMVENQCTLRDFRMVIIEEIDTDLDKIEQEYFNKLLPAFLGFNQLGSFLKRLSMRFSNTQDQTELLNYLNILEKDLELISIFYEYGYTRFNFEHSIPKDITDLVKEEKPLSEELQFKFEIVTKNLNELCLRYIPDYEKMQKVYKVINDYRKVKEQYKKALTILDHEISEKLREFELFNQEAIEHFIYSISSVPEKRPIFKKHFNKYLKSRKCKLNFYTILEKQINAVEHKIDEITEQNERYKKAMELYEDWNDKLRPKRYELIFPSVKFSPFVLRDKCSSNSIALDTSEDLFNTCHIRVFIANNGINRNLDINKYEYIVRVDFCVIDSEGRKSGKSIYIDNDFTRNSLSGIEYYEKDFYNVFVFKREPFTISSLINNKIDNSCISLQAEYKHGINDHTLTKNKNLTNLIHVLEEINKFTIEDTRFNINVTESSKCLERCLMNDNLLEHDLVKQILFKKNIKVRRIQKKEPAKKEEKLNKSEMVEINRQKRAEAYKQKVILNSKGAINVMNYISSKENVTAHCTYCEHTWGIRSDHLLKRLYCPLCK